jgi:hypothetical protein
MGGSGQGVGPARPDPADRWLDAWANRVGVDPILAIRYAVEALTTVDGLPSVPRLVPPPGTSLPAIGRPPRSGRDPTTRMLDRVRSLLAKAESSTFPAEAEAFTAKAIELTARYSVDQALQSDRDHDRDESTAIRIGVDAPYEQAKALLLQYVAEANLAQSIWSSELGFATVFGFPTDLTAVELIYASLLVQATAAMVRLGSGKRAREFRESFLLAFIRSDGAAADLRPRQHRQRAMEQGADRAQQFGLVQGRDPVVADDRHDSGHQEFLVGRPQFVEEGPASLEVQRTSGRRYVLP